MSDTNDLLETLQADVTAVLRSTPGLSLANVLSDNEGDIEAKVAKALSTLTAAAGKNGLAVVVLLPEVTESEAGLPGPPLTVKIEVRVIENVLLNRAPATGTAVRSSQAALTILSALQLRHLGGCLLYAQQDPITPLEVKKGYVSHAVTLFSKFQGFVTPKPLGVQANMVNVPDRIGIVIDDNPPVDVLYAGLLNGRPIYTDSRARDQGQEVNLYWDDSGQVWILSLPSVPAIFISIENVPSADQISNESWVDQFGNSSLELWPVDQQDQLLLSCASPGAVIHYTVDGTFPSPGKEIFVGTPGSFQPGTTIRAAAYVAGMPPGDVLEFTYHD